MSHGFRRDLPKRLPFGLRVGLSSVVMSGAALLIFIVVSGVIVFDNMIEEADFELREFSDHFIERYKDQPPSEEVLASQDLTAPLNGELAKVRILFFGHPEMNWKNSDPHWQEDWVSRPDWFREKRTHWQGKHWKDFNAWRSQSIGSEQGYGIVLAMDLGEIEREVWRMCRTFLSALPAALLIIGVGSWWLARGSVEPLKTMALAMEHVARGDLEERVELTHARDELDRLAVVFNDMTARLQTSFEQATRFTSDASHELRTPLTVLLGKLEAGLQRAEGESAVEMAELLGQTERLRAIVNGLLLLSRSDAGRLGIGSEMIDFSSLVEDVTQDVGSAIEEAGIDLVIEIAPEVSVRGDAQLLRQAFVNLLSNAEKFNLPTDGSIRVSLRKLETICELVVENPGQPIDPNDVKRVFRRFYRAHSDREALSVPGTGLGLSIVLAIVEAHGGEVRCEVVNGDNRFVIALELAA